MQAPVVTNLLAALAQRPAQEVFERLLERDGVVLERIVSFGHATAAGSWYDQDRDEWVVLLSGAARLSFEGEHRVELGPGDAVLIPAHCRHRVEWTRPDCETVWLALHVVAAAPGSLP